MKTKHTDSDSTKTKASYYVTMTDKFLSGWGMASNQTNKLVFLCDTYEEAEIVAENARNRSDMKYINICTTKPHYGRGYMVQFKDKDGYSRWYERGAF